MRITSFVTFCAISVLLTSGCGTSGTPVNDASDSVVNDAIDDTIDVTNDSQIMDARDIAGTDEANQPDTNDYDAPDAPDGTIQPDSIDNDVPADAVSDGGNDGITNLDTSNCPEIGTCNIVCDNGMKTDEVGCPVCRCKECETAVDCADLGDFDCPDATCTAGGDCICNCKDFTDIFYTCPDATEIPLMACTAVGITSMWAVEQECPTLCFEGDVTEVLCPDDTTAEWCQCEVPQCRPYCDFIGSFSEGWYDGCTNELVGEYVPCAGHIAVCDMLGSKSEGWFDPMGGLITWTQCAPKWNCADLSTVCATVACTTEDNPPEDIECQDTLTEPFCQCESDIWTCANPPTSVCAGHWQGCVTVGELITSAEDYRQCCPGLVRLRPVNDNDGTCVNDGTSGTCTACGNGACDAAENKCNCPEDCMTGDFPGSVGSVCLRDLECPPEHGCLWADDADSGICTVVVE